MWKQPTLSMHIRLKNFKHIEQNTTVDNAGYEWKIVVGMGFQYLKSMGAKQLH
jgi:hypothetical protein